MDATKSKIRFTQVDYSELLDKLVSAFNKYKKDNDCTEVNVAADINTGYMTIRNAVTQGSQTVSDKVLTMLMDKIGMEGKIEWYQGQRHYYIGK